jgi:hypothetical protein
MSDKSQQQSRLKELIARGKEQGYLTYAEVNDHLPEDIADPDQVEDIIRMINDMGIRVADEAPDAEDLLPTKKPSPPWPRWNPMWAAPPTRCACTCARWARSSY